MAAELEKEPGVSVKLARGGFGELSVSVDGLKIYKSSRIWYPTPNHVIESVRAALAVDQADSLPA